MGMLFSLLPCGLECRGAVLLHYEFAMPSAAACIGMVPAADACVQQHTNACSVRAAIFL